MAGSLRRLVRVLPAAVYADTTGGDAPRLLRYDVKLELCEVTPHEPPPPPDLRVAEPVLPSEASDHHGSKRPPRPAKSRAANKRARKSRKAHRR